MLTSNGTTWFDYDGDGGTTIRFGDGTFGSPRCRARSSACSTAWAAARSATSPRTRSSTSRRGRRRDRIVSACTNPFPATGGADAETIAQVRDRAPQQFSAEPLRVVRAGDYVAAAQSLPWVQQAGTTFRWTGSWLTVLTSAEPAGSEEPTIAQLESLTELLNRRRLAGYESYVLPPRYVSIDLQITVCAQPAYFGSDVEAAVLAALQPGPLPGGAAGFFDHSRWGFGEPLESSALLAAIQSCPGVDGVSPGPVPPARRPAGLGAAARDAHVRRRPDPARRQRPEPARGGSLRVTVEGSK